MTRARGDLKESIGDGKYRRRQRMTAQLASSTGKERGDHKASRQVGLGANVFVATSATGEDLY